MTHRKHKYPILTSPSFGMTAIIKAVGVSCNLKCDYCFFNNMKQSHRQIMPYRILERFTTEYLALFNGDIQFIWHGGEPLLAGIDFYQDAVNIQQVKRKDGSRIQNLVQTNGTLITEDWASFFKVNDFKVGISLDGVGACHNRFRRTITGEDSFEKVIESIAILRDHDIEPGIIQTYPKSSLKYTKENFAFLTEVLKLKKVGLNIFYDAESLNPLMKDESLSNDDYFNLYKNYFDLWFEKNDPDLVIREIESLMYGVLGKCSNLCANTGTCTSYITINWDGTVIPACERLLSISSGIAGNIKDERLIDIINNPKRLEFAAKINTLPNDCKKCEWVGSCYNGCTSHREGGLCGKYAFCEGQKKVLSYMKQKIGNVIDFNQ